MRDQWESPSKRSMSCKNHYLTAYEFSLGVTVTRQLVMGLPVSSERASFSSRCLMVVRRHVPEIDSSGTVIPERPKHVRRLTS